MKPLRTLLHGRVSKHSDHKKFRRWAVLCTISTALAALLYFLPNMRVHACAVAPTEPAYEFIVHPELPLGNFAKGKLGILRPQFARSYLAVAYRYLTDRPLNPAEQSGAIDLWNARLNYRESDTSINSWQAVRLSLPGVDSEKIWMQDGVKYENTNGNFLEYQCVTEDAWREAAHTLEQIIQKYGLNSTLVQNWTANQDIVFQDGSSGGQAFVMPTIYAENQELDALSRYQSACALFYGEYFDLAASQFSAIAENATSPYHALADYMIGRCYLRKATLPVNDPGKLRIAQSILQAIANDPKESAYRESALGLLDYIQARLQPPLERVTRFGDTLEENLDSVGFRSNLNEYTNALDKALEEDFSGSDANFDSIPYPVPDSMTDWIVSFQDTSARAYAHVVREWNANHDKLWLISLLSKTVSNKLSPEVLAAANTVRHTDPSWETIQYDEIQDLLRQGDSQDAGALIIADLHTSGISGTLRNALLSFRMATATTFEEFLKSAVRSPIGFSDESDMPLSTVPDTDAASRQRDRLSFDQDAANIFNLRLPLDLLDSAAYDTILPKYLRFDLLLSVWTRSVLLNNSEIGMRAARTIASEAPSLADPMLTYADDPDPPHQRMDAIYTLLKNPSFQPIIYSGYGRLDRNGAWWWCQDVVSGTNLWWNGDTVLPSPPPFLTRDQDQRAQHEIAALQSTGAAPTYLGRATIDLANKFPNDPHAPEMLYRAVMASRYGCTEDSVKIDYSKQAYQLLHTRYPSSQWTKHARYWY